MFALPPVKVNFSFARRDLSADDAKAAAEVCVNLRNAGNLKIPLSNELGT